MLVKSDWLALHIFPKIAEVVAWFWMSLSRTTLFWDERVGRSSPGTASYSYYAISQTGQKSLLLILMCVHLHLRYQPAHSLVAISRKSSLHVSSLVIPWH